MALLSWLRFIVSAVSLVAQNLFICVAAQSYPKFGFKLCFVVGIWGHYFCYFVCLYYNRRKSRPRPLFKNIYFFSFQCKKIQQNWIFFWKQDFATDLMRCWIWLCWDETIAASELIWQCDCIWLWADMSDLAMWLHMSSSGWSGRYRKHPRGRLLPGEQSSRSSNRSWWCDGAQTSTRKYCCWWRSDADKTPPPICND